mmetsp:Transcript_41401/g.39854  ORF Transcript_41401/g.39854 Transcript_41401/m.39854 type:complete len:93 (+) Transcript_41401:1483-1761(+)
MEKLLILDRVFEMITMGQGSSMEVMDADAIFKVVFYCILKLGEKYGSYLLLETEYIQAFAHDSLEIKEGYQKLTHIQGVLKMLDNGYENIFL